MNAVNISTAQLRGTLGAASLSGALSAGSVVVNDYTISIAAIDGGHRLTITRGSEVQTMDIVDGVGIAGIEKTASVGLTDVYTITMTDGSSYTFTVTNGSGGGGGGSGQGEHQAQGHGQGEQLLDILLHNSYLHNNFLHPEYNHHIHLRYPAPHKRRIVML